MIRRAFRHPIAWSPILALLAQLLAVGVAAACSNGGDFPRFR